MKLVVYGPDRRLGALHGEQVVDLNGAHAKYLKETQQRGSAWSSRGRM
jgi:hypothetical protein